MLRLPFLFCVSSGLLVMVTSLGCASASHTERAAAAGAVLGTTAGAIIGHQSGHGAEGALVGAATGALAGGLVGNAQEARQERDEAIAQASYSRTHTELTNTDLIRMTASGLADDVVITVIRTQGGSFDLSPDGLITLKANGVSDEVIQAVQLSATAPTTKSASTAVSGVVVVRPVAVRAVAPVPVRYHPRRKPRAFHRRFFW